MTRALVFKSVIARRVVERRLSARPSDKYIPKRTAGIINPAKVVRVALQDAGSVAGLLVTTEAMVAERPKKGYGTWRR